MSDISRVRHSPEQERVRRVGEILVSRGKLTRERLQEALDPEKNGHKRLGEVLISRNLVSEEDLARAVAEADGLEYVALTVDSVDPEAIPLLGEKTRRKYTALPLKIENGRLVLAMSDPTNVLALDDLQVVSGRSIRPVVALEKDIKKVQDRVFGMDEEISELTEPGEEGSRRRGGAGGTLSVLRRDEGGPVIRLVNPIIRRALDEDASDIHVEPRTEELVVRYRVDGVLKHGMSAPLHLKDSVISRLKILGDLDVSVQWLCHSIGNLP